MAFKLLKGHLIPIVKELTQCFHHPIESYSPRSFEQQQIAQLHDLVGGIIAIAHNDG
jgi:hypothetical protein